MQKRYDSKVAWGATLALVFFIMKNYGLFSVVGLTPDSFKELSDLILALLVTLGIFNNPTNADGF